MPSNGESELRQEEKVRMIVMKSNALKLTKLTYAEQVGESELHQEEKVPCHREGSRGAFHVIHLSPSLFELQC
jgi:hypothetical protein